MTPFGLLVKSYREDAEAAARLFASITEFNVEQLPVWVVVPDSDIELFTDLVGVGGQVLSESLFAEHLVDAPVAGIRPGYINQEIVKIAFWELGLASNYLPVDSDVVFLRPFGVSDFMHSTDVPYTVLLEDRDLQMDRDYFITHWRGREEILRGIQAEIELDDRRLLTCHGHQVLSATVLRSLREDFLQPRDWTYAKMLERGPYEFSWYNFWLQKTKVLPIELREPYFKVIHSPKQHTNMLIEGVTMEDVARGYLGVIVNSNFAKAWGDMHHGTSRVDALAGYLSWSMLGSIAGAKIRGAFQRRAT